MYKPQNIPSKMKYFLITVPAEEYNKIMDISITILCKSKYTRTEVLEELGIKVYTSKWRRIKNWIVLKKRGKTPIDEKFGEHLLE